MYIRSSAVWMLRSPYELGIPLVLVIVSESFLALQCQREATKLNTS